VSRYERIQDLLAEALERPASERESFVLDASADDPELAKEVLGLLKFEAIAGSERDPFAPRHHDEHREGVGLRVMDLLDLIENEDPEDARGKRIGDYTLIRVIGHGGMGVVYEAMQRRPSRRVALKLLGPHGAVSGFRGRLIREAEVIGRLQHPGIAQVYGAGISSDSEGARPYFAMEYVDGLPLDAHAERFSLDQRGKLELLAKIADAIGYAHRAGVVHRDLKPANVLVTEDGHPKVLDFGIASLSSDATIAATTMTRAGDILGTLGYMAPEQLNGGGASVGPAADVYALGIIGFELLCGHAPRQLAGLSVAAAFRVLDNETPPLLRKIDPTIPRDVATIVGTCLERDPARRYANGAELAADIRRYQESRPILARPPSRVYLAGRFAKRHRTLVGGVCATMLVLVVGASVAGVLAVRERDARLMAESERVQARLSEISAVRGILGGSDALLDVGETWRATKQMYAVRDESRGWAWKHVATSLPWVIETPSERTAEAARSREVLSVPVLDDALFGYERGTARAWITSSVTGDRTELGALPGAVHGLVEWIGAPDGHVGVALEDGRIVDVDVRADTYEVLDFVWPRNSDTGAMEGRVALSTERRFAVHWARATITVYEGAHAIYSEDSGLGDPGGMNWSSPSFDPGSRFVVLGRWGTALDAQLITVDLETREVLARATIEIGGPGFEVSADGARLFLNTAADGTEVRALPGLGLVTEQLGGFGGRTTNIAVAPDGSTVWATYSEEGVFRGFDAGSGELVRELPIGADHLNVQPVFSPSGAIIRTHTPDDDWVWLIDTTRTDPGSITRLDGHRSWIYQLAVSQDGTLLASAAPEGDILIWDLRSDRMIARIERTTGRSDDVLVVNMDMPMAFTPDGGSLVFEEVDRDTRARGITTIELESGDRAWEATGSRDGSLDAIARIVSDSRPCALYHHAALLGDGRILQGYASVGSGMRVVVRRPGAVSEPGIVIAEGRTVVRAGVAAHPGGTVYASGEPLMVRIRDARTDEVLHEINEGSASPVYGMSFSPDGSCLAMGTEDGRVLIFETEFYQKLTEFRLPPANPGDARNYVFNLVWTPDSTRLITCSGSTIRVLESERAFVRDAQRARWSEELRAARGGSRTTPGALRVNRIERWGDPHRVED
jgi:WD40 repeat protein